MARFVDLTGKKFGRLTVIKRVENNKNGGARWFCRCECGGETTTSTANLNGGISQSCGCRFREMSSKRRYKHGLSTHPAYQKWSGMNRRCYRDNHRLYYRYGGRGISVCDEWRNDFMAFYHWAMGNGFDKDLQLDRIDNDGNYCPENCRFVTRTTNVRNSSKTTLTWDDVLEMRERFANGESPNRICHEYGIARTAAYNIKHNKTWKE